MGLACAEYCHISEGDAQKTIVGQRGDCAFKEWDSSAIGIKVDYVKECFVASVLKHEINCIARFHLILISRALIELKVLLHELCGCLIDIIAYKLLD